MTLNELVLEYEKPLRLGFFLGIFAIMALWEVFAPCRALSVSKAIRWGNNLGLVVLNTALLRWLFPSAAVGIAALADEQGWGLLNYQPLPFWVGVVISVVALDFVVYLQHVMVHAIPILWRLHRVHHADPDFDVTTGARFHPIEIILSMLIKFAAIMVIGPPVVAVIIFEILLNGTAMFNHSNISLPARLDKPLRWLLVTPDMHRVHHSVHDDETNSNFGFNLPWWDRLFGTYRDQPRDGHQGMTIGIHKFNAAKDVSWLPGMLSLPMKGKISDYVINRRQWNANADQPGGDTPPPSR